MPGGIIPRADLRPSSRPPVRKAFRYPWLRDRSLNRILANPERPFSEAAPQKRGTTENSVERSLQNFSRGDVNINNEIYIKNQHPATATPGKRQHPKTSTPVQFLKNTTSAISIYLQHFSGSVLGCQGFCSWSCLPLWKARRWKEHRTEKEPASSPSAQCPWCWRQPMPFLS